MKPIVIVTGGTKGLGREISLAFARAGHRVLALYAHDSVAAQALATLLASEGLDGEALQLDAATVEPAFFNRPDLQSAPHLTLVHNACASFAPVPMHQLTWTDFENQQRVAVQAAWACSQPLLRLMLRHKAGTIVTVLTAAVEGAAPKGFAAYLTAKYALRGFTLALAAEYAPRGLKIFSVSPGYMETPLTGQWNERLQAMMREHAGRRSDPATVARQLLALAGDPQTPGQGENHPV